MSGVSHRAIPRVDGPGPYPLSFAQERLWLLEHFGPGSPAYNEPRAVRLRGPLDISTLERALNGVVARHETLRTTFGQADGRLFQSVLGGVRVKLPVVDLCAAGVDALLREETRRPFDLDHDLPIRAALVRVGAEDHVLLLVLHHIAADGWSYGVLFRELGAFYNASAAAPGSAAQSALGSRPAEGAPCPPPLPDLPIQYKDFACWQREWLHGTVLEEQSAYWKRQMAGSPPVVELPADRPRPAIQTYRGAKKFAAFSGDLAAELKQVGRREHATFFMTLLAAFYALVHRYTDLEDVVIGVPVAGRTRTEVENLIGCFVNTLVFRVSLSGNPTFRELVGRTRDTALAAYSHQDLPFEVLVEQLRPARNLSHSPVVQILFNLVNVPRSPLQLTGLETEDYPVDSGVAKFDLSLRLAEERRALSCQAEYSTDLFDAATVARMLGHYRTLLEGVAANPERRLSELPVLTEAERRQILVEWSRPARVGAAASGPACVHQLFEAQARREPDAVAVVHGSRRLTYGELDRRSNCLARYLVERGVGLDVPVGLCVERSLEMVVGMLGILKAGGAYLPLDPSYPGERLAYMLSDAEAPVVLTDFSHLQTLPASPAPACLDTDWEGIQRCAKDDALPSSGADDLVYVIYTSGSTGIPKGVAVPHRAVSRVVLDKALVEIGPGDAVAQVCNSSFDVASFEIWAALANGARLVILDRETTLSPRRLSEELDRQGVTVLSLPTALFHAAAREMPMGFRGLKTLLFAGEAADPRLVREVLRAGPPRRVVNAYGPTEAAIFATWYEVRRVDEEATTVPIGRPIAGTSVYILDRHLNPVPVGVPGELHLGGPALARGYLSQPELTAERFITNPNPFPPEDELSGCLYRTGDVVRYLPDGNIEFIGRTDGQVKIRGFRVELGEIEAVLSNHPAVRQAVVVARDDPAGGKRLVAYVVTGLASKTAARQLARFLEGKLPRYMVPTSFVTLDSLPLTANGKVDRLALPVPAGEEGERAPAEARVAPRDGLERRLAAIWEKTLGVRPVGIRDDFFELGGHSLLAVRLFSEIEREFGRRLPMVTLFEHGTVEDLAKVLRGQERAPSWSTLVPMQTGVLRPPLFWVHAGGGNILTYRNLARLLGSDQPFYAFQARGLDGGTPPFDSLEVMAAHYVSEVLGTQPAGPHFLGGHCFGGLVAYEMARQLVAQGREVALVALVDTPRPGLQSSEPAAARYIHQVLNLADFHLGNLVALPWPDKLAYSAERAVRAAHKFTWPLVRAAGRLVGRGGRGEPPPDPLQRVLDANVRAVRAYVPQVYPGRVTLFRASKRTRGFSSDPQMGWGGLAEGGVEVHLVPGYHTSIASGRNVRVLAEKLRACLDKALEGTRREAG